jgi:hydrogenase nickel incorporation protein HypA/HybF
VSKPSARIFIVHEYSVVRSLISHALAIAAPVRAEQIRCLTISLGPLSGVESLLLAEAFSVLKPEYGLRDCELNIEECLLEATCTVCHCSFEIVEFQFRCPQCQSSRIDITRGERIILESIAIEESANDLLEENFL